MDLEPDPDPDLGRDRGKATDANVAVGMDVDAARSSWSDTSRSLLDPEMSTGSGRVKGSETASFSTASLKDVDPRQLGGS
ncbi:hypothetical protein HIM_00298 [Hirsutella minnesotensis 3608]|nr:hypothetical protein HIM_00298 [Hirsutella minnesotensis 3608]